MAARKKKTARKPRPVKAARLPASWPATQVEQRAIDGLVPYARNARTHSKAQVQKIARAIEEFGWTTPVLVDENNGVIAGHGRLLAAEKLGIEAVPVIVARGWTDAQKRAYVLADNQLALEAGWDRSILAEELLELDAIDFDITLIGFGERDVAELTRGGEAQREPDEGELLESAISREGDLWLLGPHRLLCGSSTLKRSWDRLIPKGDEAALVHTDPPYGVDYESDAHGKVENDNLGDDKLAEFLAKVFQHTVRAARENAAWYVWHASATRRDFEWALFSAGIVVAQELIWIKPSLNLGWADYQWQHEPCLYGARSGQRPAFHGDRAETTVWRMATTTAKGVAATVDGGVLLLDGKGNGILVQPAVDTPKRVRRIRLDPGQSIELASTAGEEATGTAWTVARERQTVHPTQKPVALVRKAISNSTLAGELVVDPFGGSGSTLLAAEQLGRRAALIELRPNHVDAIVRRWEKLTGEQATLDGDGRTFNAVAKER